MLGDIVGKVGRDAALSMLPHLMDLHSPDFVIVNGENSAGGLGITPDIATQFLRNGVDAITLGNHTWSKRDIALYMETEHRVIRPANYPAGTPGAGYRVFTAENGVNVGVANLLGRTFMDPLDDPFRMADTIIDCFTHKADVSFFDFHAEATSEKVAFGYYLDGRASVVVGTHTHIQTADERILPHGTAYISDVGMVGPQESILGMDAHVGIQRFLTQMPHRFQVAEGVAVLCGLFVDVDPNTGRASHIERIQMRDIV